MALLKILKLVEVEMSNWKSDRYEALCHVKTIVSRLWIQSLSSRKRLTYVLFFFLMFSTTAKITMPPPPYRIPSSTRFCRWETVEPHNSFPFLAANKSYKSRGKVDFD